MLQEEGAGGHSFEKHIGKTDEYLLNRVRTERFDSLFESFGLERAGSFSSVQAANKLVSSTLSQNSALVEQVASGKLGGAEISSYFSTPTGRESYSDKGKSAYIRDTYGVKVVISRNARLGKGFLVYTAYPINP